MKKYGYIVLVMMLAYVPAFVPAHADETDDVYFWMDRSYIESQSVQPKYNRNAKEIVFIDEKSSGSTPDKYDNDNHNDNHHNDTVQVIIRNAK